MTLNSPVTVIYVLFHTNQQLCEPTVSNALKVSNRNAAWDWSLVFDNNMCN